METAVNQLGKGRTAQGMTVTSRAFKLEDHSAIAPGLFALQFDLPGEKVNKLSQSVMEELNEQLEGLRHRQDIKCLVFISGKDSIFIAGADIEMIRDIRDALEGARMAAEGQAVIEKIESLPFPVVAAIHGASMGGGTELALCCRYLIASDAAATRIALPEVNLGVLPGFGGTVRMPARVGLQTAMDLILTGKNVPGAKALKLGLVDAVLPHQEFKKRALEWSARVARGESVARTRKETFMSKALEGNPLGRAVMFSQARKMIMSKTGGHYPAPLKILEVLSEAHGADKRRALAIESKAFGELAVTRVSKRLIELFFATEKIKKQTGATGFKLEAGDKLSRVGVLGAGVMGGGIAQLAAAKGLPVRMKDIDFKGLTLGMTSAVKLFQGLVRKKKLTAREADLKMALISPTTDYTGFRTLDLVVEAIVENMDVKKKVLKECEAAMGEKALFATNTSSLSVTELATASGRPENVVGMHFFNPVHKMPLVEVIRGAKTSDRAAALIFELSKRLGKTPVVVKDGPGFLVNRLLMPYLNEAAYLVAEGAPIEELDRAVREFGMPMGPATLLDEVGLDVAHKVGKILHDAFGARANPCALQERLYEAKLLGKKGGRGFYLYDEKGKQGDLNPEIYKILGVEPASPDKERRAQWIPRMMYPIINEAARCLAEGIVSDPQDVDIGMIFGTGFAPFRGGPLRWADELGAKAVVEKLEELAGKVSPRFAPCEALVEMARKGPNGSSGKTFYTTS